MTVLSIKEMYSVASRNLLSGNPAKARDIYRRIVASQPDDPHALYLLGRSELACGRHEDAILTLRRGIAACAAGDEHLASVTWNQIGECFRTQTRYDEAIAAYEAALEHDPGAVDALCNMGIALRRSGRLEEARRRLEEAVALRPNKAVAHHGLGNVLRAMGRNAEAAEAYRRGLLYNPNLFEGHNNLTNALRDLGQPLEAMEAYERALALRPDAIEVLANLRHAAAQALDFARADWAARRLASLTARQLDRGEPAAEPLLSCVLRGADGPTILQVARGIAPTATSAANNRRAKEPAGDGRIRLGYLIDDASNRPAWRRLAYLAGHHDRQKFDLRIYRTGRSLVPPGTPEIPYGIVELHGVNDDMAATRIAEDALDVLIDLVGQEPNGRLGILARRPAKRMLIWSHLDLTSGMDVVDGLVTDAVAVPTSLSDCFTENLLYLPPAQRLLGISDPASLPDRRQEEVTTSGGASAVTFVALGRPLRFSEEILTAWMRILDQVEDSVLVVNRMSPHALSNLRAFAERQGVAGARLIVAPRQARRLSHLKQLASADIALDTAPQSSGAAVLDALSVGLPVVSVCGSLPTQRTGASLLAAFDRCDGIAGSTDDYVTRAVAWARTKQAETNSPGRTDRAATESVAMALSLLESTLEALAGR